MTIDAKKIAGLAVKDIVSSLTDRHDMRVAWESIDDNIRRDIRRMWCAIVEKRINDELHPEPIERFSGKYRFLSNFFPSPIAVVLGTTYRVGMMFPSVEHAYQAMKIPFGDETIDLIRRFTNPELTAGQAKRMGRSVQIREDWEDVKLGVMEGLLIDKFIQNPDLRAKLVETGEAELVEGNTWGDTFWGRDERSGIGENHLGYALMRVRDRMKDPNYVGPR